MFILYSLVRELEECILELCPLVVLSDTKHFPRSISAGAPCRWRYFAALMRHIHNEDAAQNTVLMVQVENEIGYLGIGGRDRSKEANKFLQSPVPAQLGLHALTGSARLSLIRPQYCGFSPSGVRKGRNCDLVNSV